jgi:hypothetical protein
MLLGLCIFLVGCAFFEGAHSVEAEVDVPEELKKLEDEVFQLYSLAPCSKFQEYCSFPFLIERVDALIAAYCDAGFAFEANRVYEDFEHFVDPSAQPPECAGR